MATNLFFNNFFSSQEQQLLDDLVTESIRQYGIDVYYIPRTIDNKSDTFREAIIASFNKAIEVDVYIKNIDGFSGDGKFLSKFGLEIRDSITFTIARTRFFDDIQPYTNTPRPNEGDLIFFPLNKKVFQIKFVDHETVFYQLGSLQMFDLSCELFEYSNEVFNTGIPEIDLKYNNYSTETSDDLLLDTSNNVLLTTDGFGIIPSNFSIDSIDPQAMNDIFNKNELDIIDFSESNPFSEIGALG